MSAPPQSWTAKLRPLVMLGLRKAASLTLTGLVLGWAYSWAAPRLYHEGETPGFWMGTAHGALMPAALGALLAGRDVPIFAPHPGGRGYKIGYIAGINACGLLFFGLAFKPQKPPPPQ
jgi:drug/metabolite transporter (DMT)-like permease